VLGGLIDQWMIPFVSIFRELLGESELDSGSMGPVMSMLRMARLLRILRLVRLIKSIRPLYRLATGIMSAMQGMMWVMVLTAVVLYAFSLLSVRLIRDGILFGKQHQAREVFPNIADSVWVYFMMMNGDAGALEPLLEVRPMMKLIALLYMVLSAWPILSIFTAVVSENMISASDSDAKKDQEEERQDRDKRLRAKLAEMFEARN